jgi:hypothetical protein
MNNGLEGSRITAIMALNNVLSWDFTGRAEKKMKLLSQDSQIN